MGVRPTPIANISRHVKDFFPNLDTAYNNKRVRSAWITSEIHKSIKKGLRSEKPWSEAYNISKLRGAKNRRKEM